MDLLKEMLLHGMNGERIDPPVDAAQWDSLLLQAKDNGIDGMLYPLIDHKKKVCRCRLSMR
jgi:hypothetical protein